MRLVITSLLIVFIVSSCTVQKRLHRPGWHVSWKKNYKSDSKSTEVDLSKSDEVRIKEETVTSSIQIEGNQEIVAVEESALTEVETTEIDPSEVQTDENNPQEKNNDPTANSSTKKETSSDEDEPERQKNNIPGLILMILVLFGLFIITMLFVALNKGNGNWADILWIILGLAFFIALTFVALIASIIVLASSKKTESKQEKLDKLKAKREKQSEPTSALGVYIVLGVVALLIGSFIVLLHT